MPVTCDRSVIFSGHSGLFHNKTDRYSITEILLKVALNIKTLTLFIFYSSPAKLFNHREALIGDNLWNYFFSHTTWNICGVASFGYEDIDLHNGIFYVLWVMCAGIQSFTYPVMVKSIWCLKLSFIHLFK